MNEVAEKMEEQETQQDLDFGEDKPVQSPKANDAPFEVEIVDDRPEEDRVAKRNESATTNVEDDDDEAKNYSEKVQKRIKALKYDYHEERRAKEEASRLQEEALNYAKKLQKENEELRSGSSLFTSRALQTLQNFIYRKLHQVMDGDSIVFTLVEYIKEELLMSVTEHLIATKGSQASTNTHLTNKKNNSMHSYFRVSRFNRPSWRSDKFQWDGPCRGKKAKNPKSSCAQRKNI